MKKLALLCAGVVVTGSFVAVATPAEAATTTTDNCSGMTTQPLNVTRSSNAPTTMVLGGAPQDLTLTSVIDVPAGLAGTLLGTLVGVTGSGTSTGVIEAPDGTTAPLGGAASSVVGTLLSTGDLGLPVTPDTATRFTPAQAGDYRLLAREVTTTLSGGLTTLTCQAPAGAVVDEIRVLSPSTTTVAVSPTTVAYGQISRATAKVATSLPSLPAGLGAASGTVQFSAGGKTVSGTLTSGQTTVALPRLGAGQTYPLTAAYHPDSSAWYEESQDNASLMVVKDGTSTAVTAPNIKRRHVEVATVQVRSVHGAMVRGTVRAILKKGTKTLRAKTVALRKGNAQVRFGKLRKRGKYTVLATYRASHNFKRSVDKDALKVR